MHDTAVAVRELLVTANVDSAGWTLDIGEHPENNDRSVLINMSGGRPPYPHLALNFPSVGIIVRGKRSGYLETSAKMAEVCNTLLGLGNQVANTDTYRSCNQVGDVIYLGQDDNGRPKLSASFWFIVEPSDLGNRKAIA